MLLTERQKFILKDLLNEEKSVTAKTLAERYNVSLRTVRYDLNDIEYWLKEKGSILVKVPRVGMMVKNKEKALEAIKNMDFNINEILFSSKDRKNMILLKLIFADKPITSEEFAKDLYVSRGTIITEIKEVNKELKEYSISIEGKTNHGFVLFGKEKNIRKYIAKSLLSLTVSSYKDKLYFISKNIVKPQEIDMADEVISLLKKYSNIRLGDTQILKFKIILLMGRIKSGNILPDNEEEVSRYKTTKIYTQVKSVYMILTDNYSIAYKESEIAYFSHMILTESIDTSAITQMKFNDKKLMNVVDKIVNISCKHLNISKDEISTLSKELFSHLKITLNRFELNVVSENPILEQIKAKYGDVFEIVRKASAAFKDEYGFELSENEIGFLTMYFLKSLEKNKTYVKKNIIVVCNTSRGTSKLLATRIKNNIPEVNIKNVVSIIDIENDKHILKDVDLVISTIKIDNLDKPTLIVSPIITTYEMAKIRDFLYLEGNYDKVIENEKNYIEDTLTTIIEKYTQKENVVKLHKEIMSLMGSYLNNLKSKNEKETYSSQAELIGLILIEISDMILKLYPDDIDKEQFKRIYGIIIHVIMAVSRWQNGEYIQEKSIKLYEQKYPKKFKIIEETFNRISEKYKLPIKRTEVVAVLRYLI